MIGILHTADTQPWRRDALCAQVGDTELWFPDISGTHSVDALSICAKCPVADTCRQYAIDEDLDGIRGRTTRIQRLRMVGRWAS